ncbi:MAG: hypothetical protein ACYCZ2_16300 [Lutibacter sp.]
MLNTIFHIDKNKPFKFFEDLIFNNSINSVLDLFYTQTIITENYNLIIERNKDFIFESWIGKNDTSDLINYNKHFKLVLNYNTKKSFECLDNYLKNLEESKKKIFLNVQLNLMFSCINKIESEDLNDFKVVVLNTLFTIVSDIQLKFSHLISYHKVFIKTIDNSTNINSIFQPKPEIKRSFFKKLYNLSIDLDLIDDTIVYEDVFLDVFTSAKPQKDSKIIFIKSNPLAAHFLKEIEIFFNNFNAVTIEKSECFVNKQNKVLKSTDLYAALSRGKEGNQDYFNRINLEISALKKDLTS